MRHLGALTVANGGSVGLSYDGDWRPSYLLIDDGVPAVRRVEYDLERQQRELAQTGFPLALWLEGVQRKGLFSLPS